MDERVSILSPLAIRGILLWFVNILGGAPWLKPHHRFVLALIGFFLVVDGLWLLGRTVMRWWRATTPEEADRR
jgi:hypothetical protein